MASARLPRRPQGGPRWPAGRDPARVRPQQEAAARLDCPGGRDPQIPRHVYQRVDSHCGQGRMTRSENMEHVEVLRRYNKWRRGADGPMEDPKVIGLAIDAAIAALSAPKPDGEWVLVP